MPSLIVASASQRRHQILSELITTAFKVVPNHAPEITYAGDPVRTTLENALRKHTACAEQYAAHYILAADTVVFFEGACIGKPASHAEAHAMLRAFSGKTQVVVTAVALSIPHGPAEIVSCCSSVTFKSLSDPAISQYLEETQPYDRAGAYDINTRGTAVVESFSGDFFNIMGLPANPVKNWLVAHQFFQSTNPQ